jgi:uncharacterized protein YqfA (UPF0365 family)
MGVLSAWREFRREGVPLSFSRVVGMRLRRTLSRDVIEALVTSHKNGLGLTLEEIEVHYLAGGSIAAVVDILVMAQRRGVEVPFGPLSAIDLFGRSAAEWANAYFEAYRRDPTVTFRQFVEPLFGEEQGPPGQEAEGGGTAEAP